MRLLTNQLKLIPDAYLNWNHRVISGNDVLTVKDLTKSFPGQTLFTDINFEIKRGERVALIGNNGTGKTTILKIIKRFWMPIAGSFTLGSKVTDRLL